MERKTCCELQRIISTRRLWMPVSIFFSSLNLFQHAQEARSQASMCIRVFGSAIHSAGCLFLSYSMTSPAAVKSLSLNSEPFQESFVKPLLANLDIFIWSFCLLTAASKPKGLAPLCLGKTLHLSVLISGRQNALTKKGTFFSPFFIPLRPQRASLACPNAGKASGIRRVRGHERRWEDFLFHCAQQRAGGFECQYSRGRVRPSLRTS